MCYTQCWVLGIQWYHDKFSLTEGIYDLVGRQTKHKIKDINLV